MTLQSKLQGLLYRLQVQKLNGKLTSTSSDRVPAKEMSRGSISKSKVESLHE